MFIIFEHHNGNRRKRENDIAVRLANLTVGNVSGIMTELNNEIARLDSDILINNDDQQLNDDRNRTAHAKLHLQVAIDRNLESQKQAAVDALMNGND